MRLVIKKDGRDNSEYNFTSGPINIGRHSDSQVLLSDLSVSRHHAVLFNTEDGKWILEDLDSANKTYLDGQEIKKSEVKDGSVIRIGDFTIEIAIEVKRETDKETNLEDTLEKTAFHIDSFEAGEQHHRL